MEKRSNSNPIGKLGINKQRRNPAVNPVSSPSSEQYLSGGDRSILESNRQSMLLDQSMGAYRRIFQQIIEAGQDSLVSNNLQSIVQNLYLAKRPYYFDLKILEKSRENEQYFSKDITLKSVPIWSGAVNRFSACRIFCCSALLLPLARAIAL